MINTISKQLAKIVFVLIFLVLHHILAVAGEAHNKNEKTISELILTTTNPASATLVYSMSKSDKKHFEKRLSQEQVYKLKPTKKGKYVKFKKAMTASKKKLRIVVSLPEPMTIEQAHEFAKELKKNNPAIGSVDPNIPMIAYDNSNNCDIASIGLNKNAVYYAGCNGINETTYATPIYATNSTATIPFPVAGIAGYNATDTTGKLIKIRWPFTQWFFHDAITKCSKAHCGYAATLDTGVADADIPIIASTNIHGAWKASYRGNTKNIVVIMDSGVATEHVALKNRFLKDGAEILGHNTFTDDNNISEGYLDGSQCNLFSHGTFVSGMIFADEHPTDKSTPIVVGIDRNAKLLPIKTLACGGGSLSDVTNSLNWIVGLKNSKPSIYKRIKVINMSLGADQPTYYCPNSLQDAINSLANDNKIIVVAAGNNNSNAYNYAPGNCHNVITVGSVDFCSHRTAYSNYGEIIALAAPGGMSPKYGGCGISKGDMTQIKDAQGNNLLVEKEDAFESVSISRDDHVIYKSYGTSFSAPIVTGVISLMLGAPTVDATTLSLGEVFGLLKVSANPFKTYKIDGKELPRSCKDTNLCGSGSVNAKRSIDNSIKYVKCIAGTETSCNLPSGENIVAKVQELAKQINYGRPTDPPSKASRRSSGNTGLLDIILFALLAGVYLAYFRKKIKLN